MESFIFVRKHLAMCGIIEQQTPLNSHPFNLKNSAVLIVSIVSEISVIKLLDEVTTFEDYTDIIYRISFVFIANASYVNFVWKTPDIFGFISRLEASITQRIVLHPELRSLYTATSQRIQKWIKALHFIYMNVIPILFAVPSLVTSLYIYFTTDLGSDAFELLYTGWYPFDTKTPVGFSMALVFQYINILDVMIIVKSFVLIGITTLPMLFPLIDDIKRDLKTIRKSLRHEKKRSKIAKPLAQFVQFHSDTKQLARDFLNFWQNILTIFCLFYTFLICSELLLIEIKMHQDTNNNVDLINLFIQLNSTFAAVLCICEFGERASMAFDEIEIAIGQLKWYLLPCDKRKMLLTILIVAQEPVEFNIFGSISSNRKTFKEICHKVYSTFMVLRRFGR